MYRQLALAALLFTMEACSPPGAATSSAATIHSFIASPASIAPGQTATLAATFSNGTGRINQGIGPIASGAPVIVAPSANTTYTLVVTDAMGSPVSRTAAVSVAIPGTQVVTLTASPPSLTNQTTASFSFSSSQASSVFNCKLDSGAVAACSSPRSYSDLTAGQPETTTLKVNGRDTRSLLFDRASIAILGPFVDYYIDPKLGWHAQGAFGIATMAVGKGSQSQGTVTGEKTMGGLGFMLGGGYEWWIAEQWSMGALLRFVYVSVESSHDDREVWMAKGFAVPEILFGATYH